jgi:serine/threonine-protein kinase
VGSTRTEISNSVSSGVVLSTSPPAGRSVAKNSAVNLVVSAGPPVNVPDVRTQQVVTAEQNLTAVRLGYVTNLVSSNQPEGQVLDQNPGPGQKVKAGSKVTLTVSGHQNSTTVPSLVGLSALAAGSKLSGSQLTVGNQTTGCPAPYPAGQVAAQNPQAGTTQPPNTPVNIVVSNCVSVPGVQGQSANDASNTISNQGLTPNQTTDAGCANGASPGQVESQNPRPGALVAQGVTVTIVVCQPPTTTTSSSTTTTTTPSSSTSSTSSSVPHGQGQG